MSVMRFILLSCSLLPCLTWGQASDVLLIAKAKKSAIWLRWAPTNPNQWQAANKSGYVIERYTITRGKQILRPPSKIILSPALKPRPLAEWERPSENNDYVAIAAEALYGSDFEVGPLQATPFDVVNRSRQLEQRFSFALLAADHSFETALLSGLGWVDAQVRPDEKYLYRIHVANADSANSVPATFYISLADTIQVLPPAELRAQFGDKQVMLTWPKTAVEKTFTSYIIERKQAGEPDFKRVNNAPFLNPGNEEDPYFRYIDSLSSTGSEVAYRIRGITAFGEISPASAEVKGISVPALKAIVSSFSVQPTKESEAWLRWQISGDKKQISSVKIERGSRESGPYFTIQRMSVNETEWRDQKPLATAYYRIKLMGERDSTATFPHLLQLYDSIPPFAPVGVTASADGSGRIRLNWTANRELDLMGYEVFRSNFKNAEFSRITPVAINDASYIDSVEAQSLTKSVYYRVAALDNRHNLSPLSDVIEVRMPDMIPPVPPAISQAKVVQGGVELRWIESTSIDVAFYDFYRVALSDGVIQKLATLNRGEEPIFVDSLTSAATRYEYRVVARDSSSNTSQPARVQILMPPARALPFVFPTRIAANREDKRIEIRWDVEQTVKVCYVYRAEGDEPLAHNRTVQRPGFGFFDDRIKPGLTYEYRLKFVFEDGLETDFSKELKITF